MKNPFSYQGKRVVITGAYSGVGAAAVELLSSLDASEIIALDIREPQGPITRFIQTNMADPAAIDAAVAAIDGPVDALFNNAGVAATFPAVAVMKVNYLGPRRLSEAMLPKIPEGGAITFTASIAGGQWAAHLTEILELLAIEPVENVRGRSLVPLIQGGDVEESVGVVAETHRPASRFDLRALVFGDYKFIRNESLESEELYLLAELSQL